METSRREGSATASLEWCKPGANFTLKILPEPPTERDGWYPITSRLGRGRGPLSTTGG
jgi:hypothetical protein